MHFRSKTGCLTCKRRHRKCDETHPICRRCVSSGLECYFAQRDNRVGITRSSGASTPEFFSSSSASSSQFSPNGQFHGTGARPTLSLPISGDHFDGMTVDPNEYPLAFSLTSQSSDRPLDLFLPVDNSWHASLQMSTDSGLDPLTTQHITGNRATCPAEAASPPGLVFSPTSSPASASTSSSGPQSRPKSTLDNPTQRKSLMSPGQASLFEALLSLAQPGDTLTSGPVHLSRSLHQLTPPPEDEDVEPDGSGDNDDPEGVVQRLCIVPVLDSNAESNTLAFVLQSYARWLALTVFDPLRIAHLAKSDIIRQVSNSATTRTRIILVANVFNILGKAPDLNEKGLSIISSLRAGVYNDLSLFKAHPPSRVREMDMQEALEVLTNILEVISIHFYASPLPALLALMQAAAPVFRRACPEPPERLVNLPSILWNPELQRRYFAVIDIGLSITTNRPMLFRYDVTYPPEICDTLVNPKESENTGMEWMYGIPDQFVVLFAWMNALREDFYGRNVDPELVRQVEERARNAKVGQNLCSPDTSPVLRIRRMVVQESWRQVVYIFLYMNLCGANAKDPRVNKAFAMFMRLVRETKPARNPDAFLFIPMLVAGVAACKQHDRDTLRRRMLGVRECSIPGIVGNDGVRVLMDIWAQTDAEGRVAVWSDFGISYNRVVGL
ncbi:hypothetical protein CTheo_3861 [Ceratobasidium theobromae]|uniref:Zn(2)-C6 fungal-type domain-containing protein n=1 Tax=Ceratobasidium theobromae TaxID=1582974 RepID=A0A5N5QMC7_9AGAM|nr:hypothetical protein CTheo_3861 [Ceratobasidium theobromae]